MKEAILRFTILCFGLLALSGQSIHAQEDSITFSIDFEDVVVTAQFAPTNSKNAVHNVRTISKETIAQRGVQNLEQLIDQEANLRITKDRQLGGEISMQGFGGQGIKIMVDGVPIIGRQDGFVNVAQINLNNIERIEIVEGPLGVIYGTDALAGVINIITKKSQIHKYEVSVSSQYEALGFDNVDATLGARLSDKWLLQVNGGASQFDGVQEDSSRYTLWNPKDQQYVGALLRYDINENQHLAANVKYFREDVITLGEVRRPEFKPYAFDDDYFTKRLTESLSYRSQYKNDQYVESILSFSDYYRQRNGFRTNFVDSIKTNLVEESRIPEEQQQDTSSQIAVEWRTTYSKQNEHWGYMIGTNLRYDNAEGRRIRDTTTTDEGFADIGDYAVFTSVRYAPKEKLIIEAGLRYAYNTRFSAPVIPSLNIKYQWLPQLELRASVAQGFRSPDLKELYFNFVDINHNISGNPNLQAEKSNNIQLGLTYARNYGAHKATFSMQSFYNEINNRIGLFEYKVIDGVQIPVADTITGFFTYFNQEKFKSIGLNSSIGYTCNNWSANIGLSTIGFYNPASEILDDVETFSPTYDLSGSVTYAVKNNFSISLFGRSFDKTIQYYPGQNDQGETVTFQKDIGGYEVIDLTATKFFWNNRVQLGVGVKNLLNIKSITVNEVVSSNHSGGSTEQPVLTGRNFFVRLGFNFGW